MSPWEPEYMPRRVRDASDSYFAFWNACELLDAFAMLCRAIDAGDWIEARVSQDWISTSRSRGSR